MRSNYSFFALLWLVGLMLPCQGFVPTPRPFGIVASSSPTTTTVFNTDANDQEKSSSSSAKLSLEEKMKAWEATEEEIKAATLGGVVPQKRSSERSDAFDIGLYMAFPIMVLTGLAFAFFPFIMGNLDVDSVGPPPTE